MISYQSFSFLPQEEQAKHLWKDGVALEMIRYTPDLTIELYSLHDFYVEIFFDKDSGEPLFLKSFNDVKGLDLYFGNAAALPLALNVDGLHS